MIAPSPHLQKANRARRIRVASVAEAPSFVAPSQAPREAPRPRRSRRPRRARREAWRGLRGPSTELEAFCVRVCVCVAENEAARVMQPGLF